MLNGWQLYIAEMMRCFAYLLMMPGVLVAIMHHGRAWNENQVIAACGLLSGLFIRTIKTLEMMSARSYVSRYSMADYTAETYRTLWLQTQEMENTFWGAVPVTCACFTVGFLTHSLMVLEQQTDVTPVVWPTLVS